MIQRNSIRTLTMATILTGSLITGVVPAGSGTFTEVTLNPQKQLNLEPKELPRDKPIQQPKKAEIQAETEVKPLPKPKPNYKELTVEATAYVSFCDTGCIGITKGGTNVRNDIYHDSGLPIIATDPKVIPLGSIVEINGQKYISDDTGGAIKGNRIDILVATKDTSKAFEFGRQELTVKVYY